MMREVLESVPLSRRTSAPPSTAVAPVYVFGELRFSVFPPTRPNSMLPVIEPLNAALVALFTKVAVFAGGCPPS